MLFCAPEYMSKKILVIEDDEDILTILNIIFEEEGFEVVLFNTGTTAAHIKLIHPDLILLDVRIAGYNKTGAEICAEIKSNPNFPKIPVLLVSAEADIRQLAKSCGADGYVSKPFDISEVILQVKEFLN